MASKEEIDRLAAAVHELRPDWPVRSLVTYIARHHGARAYGDLAVAFAAIATDPKTQTPNRVSESGPWWQAAQVAFAGVTVPHVGPGRDRCTVYGHEAYPAATCAGCRTEMLGTGFWPAESRHRDATVSAATEPDGRMRAAGER